MWVKLPLYIYDSQKLAQLILFLTKFSLIIFTYTAKSPRYWAFTQYLGPYLSPFIFEKLSNLQLTDLTTEPAATTNVLDVWTLALLVVRFDFLDSLLVFLDC